MFPSVNFMCEHLDPVFKVDQCTQYVDDIRAAPNNAKDITRIIHVVFECIRKAGLKLVVKKIRFGVSQFEILGRTIWPERVSPQTHKNQIFHDNVRLPKKALQPYLGFVYYYKLFSRMVKELNPFSKLLKAETPINKMSELMETFDLVNKALSYACELALKQHLPGKHSVSMTNAFFRCAVNVLKVGDNSEQRIQSWKKVCAPVALRSKTSSPAQLKTSVYSEESLAHKTAFLEFSYLFWKAAKPRFVLTDNKSVTRFFRTKTSPQLQ